jgi:peptidoglycan hydrolase-like protein with peptidoglycan-binding domain
VFRVRTRVLPCLAGTAVIATAGLVAAAPAGAQSAGGRTLHRGAKGSAVSALQADLSQAGFVTSASGHFTSATAAEVKRFQRFYQLNATGSADARTLAVLRQVDTLDAAASDASTAAVKVRRAKAKPGVTNDLSTLVTGGAVLAPVQQNGGSAHFGNRVLKEGMHGHDVRVLQAYLTVDGYATTVDGDFGPSTESSVVAWQSASDVTDDGIVSYADSRLLRKDVAKVESTPKTVNDPTTTPTTPTAPTTPTTTPGATATIDSSGNATAPASAPALVQEMIAAANSIDSKPYIYAGGHASWNAPGYDCSGSVSFVLHAAGLLSTPEDSTQLESFGSAGAGQWVTVYANAGHTWIVIAGLAFDTGHWGPTTPAGSGPRWLIKADATANLNDGTGGYVTRHPSGL